MIDRCLVVLLCFASLGPVARGQGDVLDALHAAAARGDGEAYFGLFSDDATFLGTDRRERWSFEEFRDLYEPYMDAGRGWTYHVRDRDLRVEGDWAWFDETLWHDEFRHCRGSGVLTRLDGAWKIRQYNLTFPVPNEASRRMIATSLTDDATRLRAMTFNIRYDNPNDNENAWPNRADGVGSLIRRNAPDIAGVQEALWGQVEFLADRLHGYAWVGVGRDDGRRIGGRGEYAPIFYLSDRFALVQSGTFWLSPTPDAPGSTGYGNRIPRIATWAELRDRVRGDALLVVNAHFDHESGESRRRSAEQIVAWAQRRLDERPVDGVLIMGDFNMPPSGGESMPLTTAASVALPDGPTFNGWQEPRGEPIDWIAEIGALELASVRRLVREATLEGGRFVSDHFPVVADYTWE